MFITHCNDHFEELLMILSLAILTINRYWMIYNIRAIVIINIFIFYMNMKSEVLIY